MATVYVALLRGVNIGAKNRVNMADIKQMCESLGLSRVETYIQSGNVIFESEETEDVLRNSIEKAIKETFGFNAAVILRTAGELERIVRAYPFSEEETAEAESANTEGESRYVSLLARPLPQEAAARLDAYVSERDRYRAIGRDIYLLFSHSIRNSKLAACIDRLNIRSTVRNWRTLKKLCEIAQARDSKR
jgi:uncharacterized protein (DUF1697 family)